MTPIIHADLGDGKRRRLFMGADELRQIKRETGRGFYSLYRNFHEDAEPDEVAAILRLALIGGGATPSEAGEVVEYYARPPRPLRAAYLTAFEALHAAWAGVEDEGSGGRALSPGEMDRFFTDAEAELVKNGLDAGVLRGKSFAEIVSLLAAMSTDKDKPSAPDQGVADAIRELSRKVKK